MKTKNKHFGRLLCCSFAAVVTTAAVYAAFIALTGLFGLGGCTKDDGVALQKVGTARLCGFSSDITYGVWKKDGSGVDSQSMPLVLVKEGGSWDEKHHIFTKCILVDEDRFYVGKDLSFTKVSSESCTVRPFFNDAVPIDSGNFGVKWFVVTEKGDRRYYLCYSMGRDGEPRESLCLTIPRQKGCLASQETTNKFIHAQERVNVLSGANLHDPISTNFLEEVKLDKPFLFFPRMTYYDNEGAGVIAGRMCSVKLACQSRQYAMEHVLAPVTNAIAVGYGMKMDAASGAVGAERGDWAYFALSGKIGTRIDVVMRSFQPTRDAWQDYFVFELSIHEKGLLGLNDWPLLKPSQSVRNKDAQDQVWKGAQIARRTQAMRMPTVVDDWHELSADEIERTRNFSLRSHRVPGCSEMMEAWCSNRLGVALGMDARRIPWLSVADKTGARGFRCLLPTVDVSTNGWSITEVHANRRRATIFGVKATRKFPSRAAATVECIETMHEIENMAYSCFTKYRRRKDAPITEEQVRLVNSLFNIVITLPHEVRTNCWEYGVDLVVCRLQDWIHVTTTSGCFAEPD